LDVLAALARRFALVAVVSGRPVEYLDLHLGRVPQLVLVGLYGLQRLEGGRLRVAEGARPWGPVVAGVAKTAQAVAPDGVSVEMKGLTVVLHARRRPDQLPWATQWAQDQAKATGLRAQPGKLSVEILPPIDLDKGTVIEDLAGPLQALCFLGDDVGDLPAFAALSRLRAAGKSTVAVGVASPEQPAPLAGAVDVMVDGPAGALRLLASLAAD
jgi:trehalose 6-phosphate phosphatase